MSIGNLDDLPAPRPVAVIGVSDRPILFDFHGYPWLIHRLAGRRSDHGNLHVRACQEKGRINTPLERAIENNIDRFSRAIDAIDRVPRLGARGAHARERLRDRRIDCVRHAHEHGIDPPALARWQWPF